MAKAKGSDQIALSGREGGEVYRQCYYGTIVSQWQPIVRNPRTYPQQRTRAKLATLCAAYKAMRPVCSETFEGLKAGGQSMNRFYKINTPIVSKIINRKSRAVPNEYQISEGTINGITADSWLAFTANEATTLGDFNSALGSVLQAGDTLKIVYVITSNERLITNMDGSQPAGPVSLFWGNIIMPTIFNPSKVIGQTLDSMKAAGLRFYNMETSGGKIFPVGVPEYPADKIGISAMGCIISRRSGLETLFSSALLKIMQISGAWNEEASIDTYNPMSDYYLNDEN